jgi:hypothetical protein
LTIAKLVHKEIICHTVKMLKNSKISQYKTKKCLKYFTEDFTSRETSKLMKLDKKTINRYYNIFREIILHLITNRLKMNPEAGTYIGYIKAEYGPKSYLKVYKVNEKTFLLSKLCEKPDNKHYAMHDKDFNKYLGFLYERFNKFHGLTGQGYYYQLFESILRYNYSEENLYNLVWEQLQVRL